MNDEIFKKNIEELGVEVTDEKLELLERYFEILKEYNLHTNLTRIIEKNDVYLKHFYDSLTLVKIINFKNQINILDIGSGAGFPGVVLKIFYPNINLSLLDSNNKKTKFLEYLCKELHLDVIVINDRAENHTKNKINFYDVVVARAVANLRVLTELSLPLIKEKGNFIAMKSNISEELQDINDTLIYFDSVISNTIEFKLPIDNSLRTIVLFTKTKKTNMSKLRSYDKIVKFPLKNIIK